MKNLVYFLAVCLSLFFIMLTGCDKRVRMVQNDVSFDSISVADTYYLHSDPKNASCNLQVDFLYPDSLKNTKILDKLQTTFIEKVLGEKYSHLTPQEAVLHYKIDYIDDFKQFENEFGGDPLEDDEMKDETGFSYYLRVKDTVLFNNNGLLSFLVEAHNYEGGAHGSHSVYTYIIDLTDGNFIDEEQIFEANYKQPLTSIILDKITEANKLKDPKELENIGYGSIDDIVPNGNFYVDKDGITYYFNENEIASYVMGITKVAIPYNEISAYLKKDSPIARLAGY